MEVVVDCCVSGRERRTAEQQRQCQGFAGQPCPPPPPPPLQSSLISALSLSLSLSLYLRLPPLPLFALSLSLSLSRGVLQCSLLFFLLTSPPLPFALEEEKNKSPPPQPQAPGLEPKRRKIPYGERPPAPLFPTTSPPGQPAQERPPFHPPPPGLTCQSLSLALSRRQSVLPRLYVRRQHGAGRRGLRSGTPQPPSLEWLGNFGPGLHNDDDDTTSPHSRQRQRNRMIGSERRIPPRKRRRHRPNFVSRESPPPFSFCYSISKLKPRPSSEPAPGHPSSSPSALPVTHPSQPKLPSSPWHRPGHVSNPRPQRKRQSQKGATSDHDEVRAKASFAGFALGRPGRPVPQ
ncbi:hypothetical protein Mp_4g21610 [Marchantia polymorpha subsp. ruderalis]|uniref:Uncharacterized protein n=2 Tax=Marchantia polymorpha TaxID=3197 RepID=A0AAF6BCC6_MARPO|nr:hypothetical protein MARPO_0090s0060 [Marchantia polymorpha]BBN09660.1 hypothetical protein Mp_4g21610 [Marchantia polymorpha subsp. ruderalis]|eukprot:PTQ33326.1 hypothetical protein MARPO_0090s0060 [Marchantia polymorpha]